MRISDWSSDVCSSDLLRAGIRRRQHGAIGFLHFGPHPGERVLFLEIRQRRSVPSGIINGAEFLALANVCDKLGGRRFGCLPPLALPVGVKVRLAEILVARLAGEEAVEITLLLVGEARSEERRVGKAGVSTCRSRWSPD